MRIFLLIAAAILNISFWFQQDLNLDSIALWMPLLSIILSVIFISPKIKNKKIEFKLIYLLLLGIFFFNTKWYLISLTDKQEILFILNKYSVETEIFIKSNLLLGISIPLIVAGYLTKNIKYNNVRHLERVKKLNPISINSFLILSVIFILGSVSVTGFSVGSTFAGTTSYFYVLAYRAVMICCAILAFNNVLNTNNKTLMIGTYMVKNKWTVMVLALFCVYVLIGGDRGPVMSIILMFFFGYLISNRMNIKFTSIIFILIAGYFLVKMFTYIEVLRAFDSMELSKNTLNEAFAAYQEYENVGSSEFCTCLAIEGIENHLYPHTYGLFLIQAIIKGVPYIGNFIINMFFGDNFYIFSSSDHLITIQQSGIGYTSGLGTTYLADTYIEFGLLGIIIISFLYGMMVSYFDNKCKNLSFRNFSEVLLISLFVGFSIYTGRSTLSAFLVYFIHIWIMFTFVKIIFRIFGYNIYKQRFKTRV